MNLKEAFRYQNKYQDLLETTEQILTTPSNVTTVMNTHLRHSVMPEVQNETVRNEPESEYYQNITDIVRFMVFLLGEKSKLYAAIRKAKNALDIDFDSEISLNHYRQEVAKILRNMNDLRNSEQVISNGGTGYRFNADGNQVTYRCDLKRVTTINFDRKVVCSELKKLNRQSDETSAKIDLCMVSCEVEYEPVIDAEASFAESFDWFLKNRAA